MRTPDEGAGRIGHITLSRLVMPCALLCAGLFVALGPGCRSKPTSGTRVLCRAPATRVELLKRNFSKSDYERVLGPETDYERWREAAGLGVAKGYRVISRELGSRALVIGRKRGPGGDVYAFWLLDKQGHLIRRLTEIPEKLGTLDTARSGDRLLLSFTTWDEKSAEPRPRNVFMMVEAETAKVKTVCAENARLPGLTPPTGPVFSPDGRRIAFYRQPMSPATGFGVWVLDLKTRKRTELTYEDGAVYYHAVPKWETNEKLLFFRRNYRGPGDDLYRAYVAAPTG